MWKHKWSSRNFLRQIKNSPWSRSKDRIITPLIVLQFRILLDPNPDKKFDSESGFRARIITPLFWMWKTFSWSNWIHRLRFMLCGKGRRILGDDTIEIFPGYRTSWLIYLIFFWKCTMHWNLFDLDPTGSLVAVQFLLNYIGIFLTLFSRKVGEDTFKKYLR